MTNKIRHWNFSFHNSEVHVCLNETDAWVGHGFDALDFFESKILRHRWFRGSACNSNWYQNAWNWHEKHTKEVYSFPITPEQVKEIDLEGWEIWYGPEEN